MTGRTLFRCPPVIRGRIHTGRFDPRKGKKLSINHAPGAVFIHVTDMRNAVRWYSKLLDLPTGDLSHEGMSYSLPVGSATVIILDGYPKSVSPRGTGPRLMFTTSDIANARLHIQGMSHSVSNVEDIGSSLVFCFEDPDSNLLCILQPKSLE